ncbi:MAG TPA: ABC transporter ATP-binding protein [Polyangiaceae bacterium]|nr:ABC transporter ATP-binding protein [Polyangiaceae bacterium]
MTNVRSPQTPVPVRLMGQFYRHAPRYSGGLVLLAAYQLFQWWFDTRMRRAINFATEGQSAQAIALGELLVLAALAAFVVRVLSRVVVFNAGRIAEYELRQEILDRLLKLGPSFYRRMSTGEIMSRVTNDLVQVRLLLGFGILNIINTVFALVSALAVTIPISIKLTLATLAPLPLLLLITRGFSQHFYTRTRDNQDALGKMSARVLSSVAGVRVIRSFALEPEEVRAFEKTNQSYLDKSLALARLRGFLGPILTATISIGVLVVFWYGGLMMLHGELDAGGFLAFYRALGRLTWPLISLGFVIGLLQRGRAAFSRLTDIFSAEPDIVDGDRALPADARGQLSVKHLSFAYGDRKVLDDVSFELPAGNSLAIVGRTGSGKTSLAVLLARLQPTPRGSVFLDGIDVCDLPLAAVRQSVGYAQQNAFLFSTTVARNIGFSLDEPDEHESQLKIEEAAREACIEQEVLDLPDGFDTVVGERGVQLSGGQKQRVALAAAFASEPKVLVLDDPLSAVDARTERSILDAIDRQRKKRGLILITHRVAAAAHCDQIIVLEKGRVVERGTHQELSKSGGIYAIFAEEQRIEGELAKLGGIVPDEQQVAE